MTVLLVLFTAFIAMVVVTLPVVGQFMREMIGFLARLLAVAFALGILIVLLLAFAMHYVLA